MLSCNKICAIAVWSDVMPAIRKRLIFLTDYSQLNWTCALHGSCNFHLVNNRVFSTAKSIMKSFSVRSQTFCGINQTWWLFTWNIFSSTSRACICICICFVLFCFFFFSNEIDSGISFQFWYVRPLGSLIKSFSRSRRLIPADKNSLKRLLKSLVVQDTYMWEISCSFFEFGPRWLMTWV